MRFIPIVLLLAMLFGCGTEKQPEQAAPKEVYLKKSLDGLPACKVEHRECGAANKKCVETPVKLGSSRQCMQEDTLGDFFGCRAGDLIVEPDEPWRLDCIDSSNLN